MVTMIPNEDTSYMDEVLLDHDERVRMLPASEYAKFPKHHIQLWCVRNARYGLPTTELVEWLKSEIGGRSAIEVGAGNGDLGRLLGIPMSDNYCQRLPQVIAYYKAIRQEPTNPPKDVAFADAVAAVKAIAPSVVVGSWITHKFNGDPQLGGNDYGPAEEEMLDHVSTYIHVGNEGVHGMKPLLARPHRSLKFPWIVSRASDQSKNIIYVWDRKS